MRMPFLAVSAFLLSGGTAVANPWPDLSQPATSAAERQQGARDAALIVAIEDYAHVPDVPGARRNAADWRAWLRARGVPHVKVLQDAAAMHGFDGRGRPRGILTALEQTAAKVGPGGTLWFVFIGHGAPNGDPAQPDGLLLAQSVQQTADGLQLAGIPVQAELLPRLRPAAKGARAVAVLDACFSGKVDADRPLVAGLQPVFVASVGAVPPGVTLLTAAKGDEYAGALPGLGRPAFSYLALGALQGWADQDGDGQISGGEVRQFSEDALFEVVTGRRQTPDARGDIVGTLTRARAPKPDLAAIARTVHERSAAPSDDFDARLSRATAVEPTAPQGRSDGLEAEMARLAAKQAERERLEREEAAARARALSLHTADVDEKWAKVQAVATDPAKGVRAVEAFLAFYAGHALGNPRQADAEALKAKLEAAIDAKAQATHEADVDRAWALAQRVAKRGGPEGRQALEAFLKQYADHPRGNPKADDAEAILWTLGGAGRGKAGIEWVRMSGGSFQMGSIGGERDERPVRTVKLKSFAISKTEVTVGQYRACVQAGVCSAPLAFDECNWDKPDRDDHPINCVDWAQASTFAQWAGGRLPSEAEWEYAARSQGRQQTYPWGEAKADCSRAVMRDGEKRGCGRGDVTFPVCTRPEGNTAQGLCDMAGNAWEWVEDWYGPYGEAPQDGGARTASAKHKVNRGGGCSSPAGLMRTTGRYWGLPSDRFNCLGFRVAR